MSAYIKELKDKDNTIVYPVTKASAVYMPNGVDTVERMLADSEDYNTDIVITQNKITKTMASGNKVETLFDAGKITETTTDKDGNTIQKKTTTFVSESHIKIEVDNNGI